MEIFVEGRPRTQGNHRVSATGHVYEQNSKNLREWRDNIAWAVRIANPTKLIDACVIQLYFVLTRPKSKKLSAGAVPIGRPDIDKLVRPVLDALTESGAIADDALVVSLTASKLYGDPPGVHIYLTSL